MEVNQPTIVALSFSIAGLCLAIYTAYLQRKNNILSVRPLCYIVFYNYENDIAVKITNNGIGPLIVRKISIFMDNIEIENTLIKYASQQMGNITWTDFVENIKNRPIPTGGEIVLLRLSGNDNDSSFVSNREKLRELLRPLSITVFYKDVYGKRYEFSRTLGFFGGDI